MAEWHTECHEHQLEVVERAADRVVVQAVVDVRPVRQRVRVLAGGAVHSRRLRCYQLQIATALSATRQWFACTSSGSLKHLSVQIL